MKREAKGPATVKISLAAMPLPARGACWGMDTGLFFPPGPDSPVDPAAVAACASCPVRSQCREFALNHPQMSKHGYWGGMTESERESERRNAKRRVGSGREVAA